MEAAYGHTYETWRDCLGQKSCEIRGELERYELVALKLTLQM